MSERLSRTEMLIGKEGLEKLASSRVAVFGVGGVGGYTVEALVRSGIGTIDVIDNDTVALSNINRQIIATVSTVGEYKVDVIEKRITDINPDCNVNTYKVFITPETISAFDFTKYDYVVDAIDTVTGKIAIIESAYKAHVPVISAMGAGNKLDPTLFEVADISKTSVCPLARVIRKELKARGIERLKVVYSKEKLVPVPFDSSSNPTLSAVSNGRRSIPGSIAFVPSVVGLIIAGEVIKDIIKGE